MTTPTVNRSFSPLAIFASVIAMLGIASNVGLVASATWWIVYLAGLVVTAAWLRDQRLGALLVVSSGVLAVVALLGPRPSDGVLTVTTGASAGILTGLVCARIYIRFCVRSKA